MRLGVREPELVLCLGGIAIAVRLYWSFYISNMYVQARSRITGRSRQEPSDRTLRKTLRSVWAIPLLLCCGPEAVRC